MNKTNGRRQQVASIGGRLRAARLQAGLTLKEMSVRCALSISFLSLVERGEASPSLGSLSVIAKALGIPMSAFLDYEETRGVVTREGERHRLAIAGSALGYERLSTTLPGQTFDAIRIHVPPGYASETVSHAGEEWIYVLSGELTQQINDHRYILRAGDTCHFFGDKSHAYCNDGSVPAVLIWVGTMPVFRGKSAGDDQ
jgi:transcriptional regulator with XRE-family HTH domain